VDFLLEFLTNIYIIGDYILRDNVKEEIFKRIDRWTNYLKNKNRFGKVFHTIGLWIV
jgi:hypothetical protein